ncbi:MAG TPA: hypothetical protein VK906_02255 [Egicoccus sp.]|nr:hypothetical protein [Egicoccus sp.]HSK21965.1 hypothetical protein [Egicoccus sp.]
MDETKLQTAPADVTTPPAAQPVLPFDDESERPIAYALTARARRSVAPASLPSLTVVAGAGDDAIEEAQAPIEDPTDTRPARARALRRAGLSPAAIATRLRADELLVRGWVGETLSSVQRPAAVAPADAAAQAARVAYDEGRRAGAAEATERLGNDPAFAAGLGLLAAVSEADLHAMTLASPRVDLVVRALRWLRGVADVDPGRVRVVVRAGAGVAADGIRHDLASRLEVEPGRITVARWPAAPAPDAAEVLVRVHDPRLAARAGGWCDAFLAPAGPLVADLAF